MSKIEEITLTAKRERVRFDNIDSREETQTETKQQAPRQSKVLSRLIEDIRQTVSACKSAEAAVERAKAELKEAKEQQEEAHFKLRMLNESLLADEQRPLMPAFDQAESRPEPQFVNTMAEQDEESVGVLDMMQSTEADSEGEDASGAQKDDDEPYDWRIEPLTELALPNALHAILIHEGIETMGQLEDLRGEIIAGRKEWPKGVGPAKVSLIEDRVIDWLEEHRNMKATLKHGQEEEASEEDG